MIILNFSVLYTVPRTTNICKEIWYLSASFQNCDQ